MTKQNKKSKRLESIEKRVDDTLDETMQVDQGQEKVAEIAENVAEKPQKTTASLANKEIEVAENRQENLSVAKPTSGGRVLSLLALFIALGVGGVGYYFANANFVKMESQIQSLEKGLNAERLAEEIQTSIKMPSFETEKAQIAQLDGDYQKALERINQLEREQSSYAQQIKVLQDQVQKLGLNPVTESATWLFSEADFLLNNALRKMVLDYDMDTAKSLLNEADNVLAQISEPNVLAVRDAIKADLVRLSNVNHVDQHNLMQRLAGLANLIDDMQLAVNDVQVVENSEISDSLDDWQKNLEKSVGSFLDHFIRISDKAGLANEKAFIAPNQQIYLRENIRLRLQIAMMAVPRQQNELYKQSVEAVGSWVRSYFDVENVNVKRFLAEIDDLSERSIYIDAPSRLQSLDLLSTLLNRQAKPIVKIQLEEEKTLEQLKTQELIEPEKVNNQPLPQ